MRKSPKSKNGYKQWESMKNCCQDGGRVAWDGLASHLRGKKQYSGCGNWEKLQQISSVRLCPDLCSSLLL